MIITIEFIEKCRNLNACAPAIDYLLEHEGQEYPADHRPDWQLWAAGKGLVTLTPERRDWCAEREPRVALQYAAPLLTPERLDWCVEREPGLALAYAAPLLTPERRDGCAEREPWYALRYAAPLLTPERLDGCAERWPRVALQYAAPLLTPERLDWCVERWPSVADKRRRVYKVSDNDSAIALIMGMMLFFWIAVIGAVLMYNGHDTIGQVMVILGIIITGSFLILLIFKYGKY